MINGKKADINNPATARFQNGMNKVADISENYGATYKSITLPSEKRNRLIMKMLLCALGIVMLLLACQSKRRSWNGDSNVDSSDSLTSVSQTPVKYKSHFNLGDQSKFSFTYDDIERLKLVRIDSLQLVDLLQGDELLGYNRSDFHHYFYSYQKSCRDYQAVTVLLNVEYNYSIYYLIFSLDGKLLTKFEVAREGGDEVTTREYGYFVNDTTYLKTRVDAGAHSLQRKIVFNSKGTLLNAALRLFGSLLLFSHGLIPKMIIRVDKQRGVKPGLLSFP